MTILRSYQNNYEFLPKFEKFGYILIFKNWKEYTNFMIWNPNSLIGGYISSNIMYQKRHYCRNASVKVR